MQKILNQLVDIVKEQIEEVEHLQKDLDFVKESKMESAKKYYMCEDCYRRLNEASNVLKSLRQSLFAFRQAMGHSNIDAFYPERF